MAHKKVRQFASGFAGTFKKVIGAPKRYYQKLEANAAKKAAESPYEWKRAGGSQPIRVRKPGR